MRYIRKTAAILLACSLLAGCASGQNNAGDAGADEHLTTNDERSDSGADRENAPSVEGEMAKIDIKTKSTDSGVMKFVTEPVAHHVVEAIHTWDPDYGNPPEPYYEECTVTVTDGDSNIVIDSADAEVKVRGNWTTTYDKKPLRIKFGEKQSMLGMNDGGEYKNWLLLAEYKDISMLRNKAALKIADELLGKDGYYASDAKFAEVTINGEYWGVYLIAEQQQINEGRVEITAPEKDYTGTDIGYLLEYDGYFYNEEPLDQFKIDYHDDGMLKPYDGKGGKRTAHPTSGGKNEIGYTIKSDIYSQEQHDLIQNFVGNTYDIMYEAAMFDKAYVMTDDYSGIKEDGSITPQEAVERVVDVRSLADSYILAELTCDADIYFSSFYMDADFGEGGGKKLRFEAPWDFDSGLGNKDRCLDGKGWYAANLVPDVNGFEDDMCNPWLMVLMNEDWYLDIVKERWTELYDSGIFDRTFNMITDDSAKYEAAFKRNYDKWNNIRENAAASEWSKKAAACKDQKQAADFLRSWLESRVEFLNGEWHK